MTKETLNVFGNPISSCCMDPLTGYFRNGICSTGPTDFGTHIICAQMTNEFLEFSKNKGNDLITPKPFHHFPGLKEGDHWCLCISRWIEAHKAGVAPPVNLEATHQMALEYVTLGLLEKYALEK